MTKEEALERKAQNARDLGLDYKPSMKVEGPLHVVCQCDKCKAQPQRTWVGLTEEDEEFERIKRRIELETQPLINFTKQKEWVGLTKDDRVLIKHDANFNQFMTAGEYADRVQQLTEARLKDLNT